MICHALWGLAFLSFASFWIPLCYCVTTGMISDIYDRALVRWTASSGCYRIWDWIYWIPSHHGMGFGASVGVYLALPCFFVFLGS